MINLSFQSLYRRGNDTYEEVVESQQGSSRRTDVCLHESLSLTASMTSVTSALAPSDGILVVQIVTV